MTTHHPLVTIAPTRTLVLCDLPLRLSIWSAFAAILRYAMDQIELAGEDPTSAVHEYRKSVRRARALLRLVRPSLEKDTWRELDTILRDQVRRTSALRDGHVLLATLRGLPDALKDAHAEAFISAEERLGAVSEHPDTHALLISTQPALHLAIGLLGVELPRGFDTDALDTGLRASYRAAAHALDQARATRDAEDVHTLRKRVKELRYQLEALSAQHPDWRAEAQRARFAELAESLGVLTDLSVLAATIKTMDPELPAQQALLDTIEAHAQSQTDDQLDACAHALDHHARRWVKALRKT